MCRSHTSRMRSAEPDCFRTLLSHFVNSTPVSRCLSTNCSSASSLSKLTPCARSRRRAREAIAKWAEGPSVIVPNQVLLASAISCRARWRHRAERNLRQFAHRRQRTHISSVRRSVRSFATARFVRISPTLTSRNEPVFSSLNTGLRHPSEMSQTGRTIPARRSPYRSSFPLAKARRVVSEKVFDETHMHCPRRRGVSYAKLIKFPCGSAARLAWRGGGAVAPPLLSQGSSPAPPFVTAAVRTRSQTTESRSPSANRVRTERGRMMHPREPVAVALSPWMRNPERPQSSVPVDGWSGQVTGVGASLRGPTR